MEYDILISVILYICGCFYLFFGVYAIISNVKSWTNRLFLFLTLSMMVWSITYSIVISAPTEEFGGLWQSLSIFGRGTFYCLLLHFVLLLTKVYDRLKNKRFIVFLIYLPAAINIILFAPYGLMAKEIYHLVPSKFGWINVTPTNFGSIWLFLYVLIYSIISIILIVHWWKRLESGTILKRNATYFLISILFSFFVGILIDALPDIFGEAVFPKISILFFVGPIMLLFLSLKNFGILLEKSRAIVLLPKSNHDLNQDRTRLFHVTAILFMVGGIASFLLGYFGMGRPLERELLISALIFSTGIFLMFLPSITKKHSIQNVIFFLICSAGMLFFMLVTKDTAALTIWAVYIIFLLVTVILGSKRHALIFAIFCIALQILFWIFIPEVTVVVNVNEYVTRIFIIFLSFFVVRYLTNEYASKMSGYQKFAEEHEILERISTNFISINSENAHEKIDEMFKMSAEVLDFDQGYLIEFNADYKKANVLNAYTKYGAVKTESKEVETAAFPMAKMIINQKQPIGYTDTTSISFQENKEERDFFLSRGILSYYALPIAIEDEVIGMLVVENRKKVDSRVWENQINFLGIIANMLADAKKKIMYEQQLYDNAYYDELTKLPNRNMLIKKLEQSINNKKKSEKVAVLYIEIENLRMINDTFGHIVGDKMVTKSASILKDLLDECCYLSRIENGAFVIVVSNMKNVKQIEDFIEKITNAFSVPIISTGGKGTLFIAIVIGVSIYPDNGNNVDTLLQNADLAGYEARYADHKVVFCSDQLTNRIAETTLFTNKLFTALQNEEFFLEFQPLISSKTDKTAGVEALLRWNYDDNKRMPPDVFVPILEKTGLIHDVGLWVLEQALKEHKRLVSKGFPPLRFSVNLSIVQFREENFVLEITKIIEESKVDPKYIELEITESFLSINFADTIEKLSKLKEFGVSIAIDDFGKGYSSLHRLELVPFDRIKIDKSIVDDIISEKKKAVVVKTIVSLARALMANITAEGVETKEQLDFLKDMDCDEIQGYYYSKPLPIEALEKFLKNE